MIHFKLSTCRFELYLESLLWIAKQCSNQNHVHAFLFICCSVQAKIMYEPQPEGAALANAAAAAMGAAASFAGANAAAFNGNAYGGHRNSGAAQRTSQLYRTQSK